MNKKNLNQCFPKVTALALCMMLVLVPDARATDSNWYVGAKLPIMFIDDTVSKAGGNAPAQMLQYSADVVTEYDTGFRLSGLLGYRVNPNFRVEGEIFFGRAKVSKLTFGGISVPRVPSAALSSLGEIPIAVSGDCESIQTPAGHDTGQRR